MKNYFLKMLFVFAVYAASSFCMEPMQNEQEKRNYEQNIREEQKDFISEITYLKQASSIDNQLRLEQKSHSELDRVTIYYNQTNDLLEKSKKLLDNLNQDNLSEDRKEVKKIIYDEIYQLALGQFKRWEKWYQMERELTSRNTRGGNTYTIQNIKR